MKVAEVRIPGRMCGMTRLDIMRNEYTSGILSVTNIAGKVRDSRLR